MVSIIMPTLNAAEHLPKSLSALVSGALAGLVEELIVVDGGSQDATLLIADEAGAEIVKTEPGRGKQLQIGAEKARSDWLMFVHADTVLSDGWVTEVEKFIKQNNSDKAAVFRFVLDDERTRARVLAFIVKVRCALFALPYGDQGLLISRQLYDEIGGFEDLVLMEDVEIISRIGRSRLHYFQTAAITSAARYKKEGYIVRMMRNLKCLSMWYAGIAPEKILEKYR